jgi:hypothetical protein
MTEEKYLTVTSKESLSLSRWGWGEVTAIKFYSDCTFLAKFITVLHHFKSLTSLSIAVSGRDDSTLDVNELYLKLMELSLLQALTFDNCIGGRGLCQLLRLLFRSKFKIRYFSLEHVEMTHIEYLYTVVHLRELSVVAFQTKAVKLVKGTRRSTMLLLKKCKCGTFSLINSRESPDVELINSHFR